MAYTFTPSPSFRYVLQRGDRGESVAALQVNLRGIAVDGDFGPITETAVRAVQSTNRLVVDGIAGGATQQALCLTLSAPAQAAYQLPVGLLRGLVQNESSFYLASYTGHPSDPNGFDLGAYQDAFPPRERSQTTYRQAYSVPAMAGITAGELRAAKNRFKGKPGAPTDKRAWQLAALDHNWPFAAYNLASTGHIYPGNPALDTTRAQWVVTASGGRLSTPQQWVDSYISRACKYCLSWIP